MSGEKQNERRRSSIPADLRPIKCRERASVALRGRGRAADRYDHGRSDAVSLERARLRRRRQPIPLAYDIRRAGDAANFRCGRPRVRSGRQVYDGVKAPKRVPKGDRVEQRQSHCRGAISASAHLRTSERALKPCGQTPQVRGRRTGRWRRRRPRQTLSSTYSVRPRPEVGPRERRPTQPDLRHTLARSITTGTGRQTVLQTGECCSA